jgi:hypothetical protein
MAWLKSNHRLALSGPVKWVALAVVGAVVVVGTTRTGVDVLTVLFACFLLLVVERTLGDSIAERLGPAPTSLLFAIAAALGVAYVTTDTGQARAGRLFAAAEARGYRTAYFRSRSATGEADTKGEGTGEPARTPVRPATAIQPPVTDELASGVRFVRLASAPEIAKPGQAVRLHATLSSESTGRLPDVEFSINGTIVGHAAPDQRGEAAIRWTTAVPGQYVLRARLAGAVLSGFTGSSIITILPPR